MHDRARREAARRRKSECKINSGRRNSSRNTSTIPEVMDSSTLNFKANFKFSRFFWEGTPVPLRVCAISLCQSLACVKISGRITPYGLKYSLPRKIHLGGSMLANKTFLFVDQSSPDCFPVTREESLSITFLSDFGYLESFRRYSRSKSKVVKNRANFWTVFSSSQILGGRPSKSYTYVMTPA